ncbi:MAG: bifunctional UDP-N-acetylglucosamine diphosphorylase/glucosamine-1-phosphate N-acetyltransferase GlmU [Actinomycetia bacterium]|nr:bifunctional UDP-N-acetylglucosamine diphosphorylase/glucosamine-1-phosphate N-acetyltransferase GlmU [Actinomycetes bacterium]
MSYQGPSAVVILAAGAGTRMRSQTPKVLHAICGRPLVGHVVAAALDAGAQHTVVVCGHQRDAVEDYLARDWPAVITTVQEEQNGTGHAVRVTLQQLAGAGVSLSGGPVVVVSGDSPLLTAETIQDLARTHAAESAAVTVLTAVLPDATGYGRVIRDSAGAIVANVEHKDADAATLDINEVNSGMYAFDPQFLGSAVTELSTQNAQGEEYLPDLIAIAREQGRVVAGLAVDPLEISGVNNRFQLAQCETAMRARVNQRHMEAGVTMVDPASTYIDVTVDIEADVTLEPGSILRGASEISAGAVVGPDTTLIDTEVGPDATVNRSHAQLAVVGAEVHVGPFSFLRPGAILAQGSKVGAYVEVKNSYVGPGSKVPHLSYVGDATIGAGSNIGAATIFANYDGVGKHPTTIGDEVRVGSDTMLVAPVEIGDGAYTAAGSVITQDVPPGALGIGRGRQANIENWVISNRPDTESAKVAEAALEDDS